MWRRAASELSYLGEISRSADSAFMKVVEGRGMEERRSGGTKYQGAKEPMGH